MIAWASRSHCQSQQQGTKTKAEIIRGYEAATGDGVREMEGEETMWGHAEMWMVGRQQPEYEEGAQIAHVRGKAAAAQG